MTTVNKHKLNVLLVIASIGIMLDGLTTVLGESLGIDESNPIVGSIHLGGSLLIRVVIIALLYWMVTKITKPEQVNWFTLWFYILIILTWGAAILNTGAIILIKMFG